MTISIDRRRLLQFSSVAATLNLSALAARADDAAAKPTSPMPPVEIYAATPFIDHIALSPDGKRCALVTQKGDQKVFAHFRTDDPNPQVIPMGVSKVRGLFFGDNNHIVLVESSTASLPQFAGVRQEIRMARTVNLDTLEFHSLFGNEQGFYNIVVGDLQRIKVGDAYRITASNFSLDGVYNLCLYSFGMDSSRGTMMDEAPLETLGWVVGPDGQIKARAEYLESSREWCLRTNTSPPGKRPHYEIIHRQRDIGDVPNLIGLGRDGSSLVLRIDGQLREIAADGTLGPVLDADMPSEPIFHPVTGRLAGLGRHDDWPRPDYFDPLLRKIEDGLKVVMGDDYRYQVVDRAEDPRKMIVYGENGRDAGTYYFVDLSNGDFKQLLNNYPELPAEWITEKTPIRYAASDGLEIHGYLTLPPFPGDGGTKGLPLVVLPHGGPQTRDYVGFDWQAQVLASRGYAVLQPNFRGSDGYGRDFIEKGHGEWGRRMQTDLSDGVRWLAAQGTIDPRRVAILGASYGGYAALAGATLDPGVYRCAVSIAGPSDLRDMLAFETEANGSNQSLAVLYWKQFLGDPKTYDDISPAKLAARADCPILLIHGTDDTVVPIDQSRRMERALKAAGKPVEFVTYQGQDHWETIGSARIEMMKAALAFLDKHNHAG